MVNTCQIQAEIGWLGRQTAICKTCPEAGGCRYRDNESGIGIANTNEDIIHCTQWFAAELGYTENEICKLSTRDVTATFCWELHVYQRECVRRWQCADFNKWLIAKNRALIPIHCSVKADFERGGPVYVCFNGLMCPRVKKAEGLRPSKYPPLAVVT